jgi:NADH-quinone oxidoreductase subunit K
MGASPAVYLAIGAVLFTLGIAGVVLRRDLILMLMSLEIMLNAVNITFITVARTLGDMSGHLFVFFSLSVAAAEVAVGLALLVAIFRTLGRSDADDIDLLGG